MREMTFRDGIREVIRQEMRRNKDTLLVGESLITWGGASRVTLELADEFGDRVIETPVSENAIVGGALGCALAGVPVFLEVYSADFLFCAGSEVFNDIAKWRYQHRWKDPINLVMRMPMASNAIAAGPEHTQSIEGYLHHTPGLVVIVPGTVKDAMGALRSAIRCGDPVVFLEHRRLYDLQETVDDKVLGDYTVELGKGTVVREGADLTLVAWGWMRHVATRAAEAVAKEGISVEVLDPITIKPFDQDLLFKSVRKTRRLLVAEESPKTGSVAGELMASVAENFLHDLVSVGRVTMPDVPQPYVQSVEATVLPSEASICAKIREMVARANRAS